MSPSIEAVIDEVIIQPSKIQPMIVNFQNGALKDEETSRMQCGVYHDTKKDKTILAMSNGQVVYKGYRPDLDKELTYTMLALHNKRTGKIRLIQAERWDVAPVLDKRIDVNEELSTEDKINALSKQFGSKKSKRRTEQYERMKIDINSVKEQLEQTVSNVEIDRADLSVASLNDLSSTNDHLPPCNRDASHPSNVYNLYDIIPEDVLNSLSEKIDEILEHGGEDKSQFYVKTLKRLASDPKSTKKVAILESMEVIRKWFNIPFRDVKKRNLEICPYSTQLNNHVIETYSMNGANGRQRPTSMKDRAIIHCMILALMVCDFKLNMELFMTLFSNSRIGVRKYADLARLIGALPQKDNKMIFTLKVPLPPPLNTFKKGKKLK